MKHKKWIWLLICLFINIGILSVTKYTNFVIQNINDMLHGVSGLHTVNMIVPMGISFYTFQTMSKVNDIKASMTDEENFVDYIFPLLRYHSRWSELTKDDVKHIFPKTK